MKFFIRRFLVSAVLALPFFPVPSWSGAVFDPTRFGLGTATAVSEMDEMVEQTGTMLRLFRLSEEQLKRWEEVKKKLEVVSDFVGSVEDIDRCYRMLERSYDLIMRAESVILDDDWLDVNSRLSYFNALLRDMQSNIKFVEGMITKYSSGSVFGGRMSDYQREVRKNEDFNRVSGKMILCEDRIDSYEETKSSVEDFGRDFSRAMGSLVMY